MCNVYILILNFNPRSHEGSDSYMDDIRAYKDAFQSTLPRRERRELMIKVRGNNGHFNPRSHEGSDPDRI